jgi:hypothetical protein
LISLSDSFAVESTADDVIADARQILNSTSSDKHNGVLLKIVADAGDITRHFDIIGQANSSDFSHG